MHRVVIVGASGGIGSALTDLILDSEIATHVHATSFNTVYERKHDKLERSSLDVSSESEIAHWLDGIDSIDWLVNCVGYLHDQSHGPEKSIQQFDPVYFEKSLQVNCLPTLLLAKHAFNKFRHSKAPVFAGVSARVGSISDNRLGGWYSYRAAKAALNMSLKNLAVEWARTNPAIRVAALHPGTTDTRLSKPFQKNVPDGKLFSGRKTASLLFAQLKELHNHPSGRFIAYDGEEIPW